MRMGLKRLLVLSVLLAWLAAGPAKAQSPMSRQTLDYFSTVSALFLYTEDQDAFEEAWAATKTLLNDVEQAVSLSVPSSDISRFNALRAGERCEISPLTAEILTVAKEVYRQTDGLYDPTVCPLVDLWGFSPRFNTNAYRPVQPYDRAYGADGRLPLPEPAYVEALCKLVDFEGIGLTKTDGVWMLEKNIPSVTVEGTTFQAQLNLGGIAKGYACDRVRALLEARGYTQGHFVCGDSSMALLRRPTEDGLYSLTIGKPRPGETNVSHYATLRARNTTLSSSADNLHSYVRDGVVYCHMIDPRTGWPVNMPNGGVQQGVAEATLLTASAAYGDALTTALCVMGPLRAAEFISANLTEDVAVMACYRQGESTYEVVTNARREQIALDDPAYVLASAVDEAGRVAYTGRFFAPEAEGENRP